MINHSPLLYQTKAIQELEKTAVEECSISIDALMQRAGEAAFRILREEWPDANNIVVLCGKGNNAGDGYVVAKCAHDAGLQVAVLNLAPLEELSGAAYNAAQLCNKCGVEIQPFSVAELNKQISNEKSAVIVDALLGTGFHGQLQEHYREAIKKVNDLHVPIIAVDLPSGLHADTGDSGTDNVAIRATVTVTFIGLKRGLVTGKAAEFCGKIVCDDLDLSEAIFSRVKADAAILDLQHCLTYLPKRSRYANKGCCGHVLVVGGDYGMGGAVRMAAEAAARVGAGLVSVATRQEHVAAINIARPEIMCHSVKDASDLLPLLNKATCIVLGPGLGTADWGQMLFCEIVRNNNQLPLVVDADALNLLSTSAENYQEMFAQPNWILTPHPGEAARLLDVSTAVIQNDRYAAVAQLQQRYGGIAVLKGAGTLIKSYSDLVNVCVYGNPGMASGGMGDVLSGIIAGLLAQGLSLEAAAQLGVCLHSKAADCAVSECGERGLLALDLLPYVRLIINV